MNKYKVIENGIEYSVKEYSNGTKFYYKYGNLHRESGSAIIWANGEGLYYLNGIYYPNVSSPEELIIASIIE